MTDLRTAAQQALEALGKWSSGRDMDAVQLNDLIATLESAMEQPEQEPVAYLYHDAQSAHDANPLVHSTLLVMATERRPEFRNETPLFTHPPRREWRGLDRDETMHLMNDTAENYWADEAHIQRFARAVEATLRSKNHE
jgi:hypothetical protein